MVRGSNGLSNGYFERSRIASSQRVTARQQIGGAPTVKLLPPRRRRSATQCAVVACLVFTVNCTNTYTGTPAGAGRSATDKSLVSLRSIDSSIAFSFEIRNLRTDHQFDGQTNTFLVTYEYGGILKGAAFDPKGNTVNADTYPYFQEVRDRIISFVAAYPDKKDFYEVFGLNIARHILTFYPQIRKIEITIEIPAHGGVQL